MCLVALNGAPPNTQRIFFLQNVLLFFQVRGRKIFKVHLFKVHLSICVSVCLSVYLSVHFEVPFKLLFALTSPSWMSKIVRDSESLGKSNGKKWSQI